MKQHLEVLPSNSNMGCGGNNKENPFIAKLDSTGNVLWAIPGGNQSGGCCDDRACKYACYARW